MAKEEKTKGKKTVVVGPRSAEQEAVYACLTCRAMFEEPGMCPNCDTVLKKKAG